MKNVQISMDDELLRELDRAARPRHLTRSAAIREAVRTWLKARETERFERQWIRAAENAPERRGDADEWLKAQVWSGE